MGKPDLIFAGVPNQTVRRYVADVIERTKPERVIIPCAGAFALATAARGAGMPAESIICGDITLYSSVLGAYASGRGNEFRLEAKGDWAWLNETMYDDLGKVAAVILAIRVMQYDRPALHYQTRKRELLTNASRYLMQIRETTARAFGSIAGLRYEARDIFDTLAEFEGDPAALLLIDPPWYRLGYTKMFKGVELAFDWDEPRVPEFDPADAKKMIDGLRESGAHAHALVFYGVPTRQAINPELEFGLPWKSVFIDRPKESGGSVATWLLSNKPDRLREMAVRHDIEQHERPRYKLFEGPILPDMTLQVKNEKQSVVSYYRDLLVHRLGLINSELYQVLLLDGMLLACLGFHVGTMRTSAQYGVAKLTFAFNVHHERYPKLNKLVLMCACSSWLWEPYLSDIEEMPTKVQTTMMTPYPETKIARGVMKMTARQKNADGTYKLTYYADIVQRTAEETLNLWLERYAR
jgi:hypothetical protein